MFQDTKTNLHQLSRRRAQGRHLTFAVAGQAFVLGLDVGIASGRHDRRHVQLGADGRVSGLGQLGPPLTLLPDSCCTGASPK